MPISANFSAVTGPTPHKTRTGSGAKKAASCPGGTTVSPPGLSRSEATLATSLLVATPSEADRPTSARTRCWRRRARSMTASQGDPSSVRSRKASSMLICSTSGEVWRRMLMTRREYSLYSECRGVTTMASGQRARARAMGMAE